MAQLYRLIPKVTDKLQECIERSEYSNFRIKTYVLQSNSESVQVFECKKLHCDQHINERNNPNLYKI